MRPIWKGNITFGLVNIPVILYSAEKKAAVQFKLVDSRDKSRIKYVRINEQTGKEVPWPDIAKAYEYGDQHFVLLTEEDIKLIAKENSKTVDIENFVDVAELDYMDFEKPYYLVPDKKGEKGYVILREVLRETGKVGIAKVIIHTKEYLAAILPYNNALILDILRYHEELKEPKEFELPKESLKEYKISSKEIGIAKQLVDSMTTKWDPDEYKDEYRLALEKWIEAKTKHKKPAASPTKATSTNVVDFVDLLKKSLADKQGTKPTSRVHRADHSRRVTRRSGTAHRKSS